MTRRLYCALILLSSLSLGSTANARDFQSLLMQTAKQPIALDLSPRPIDPSKIKIKINGMQVKDNTDINVVLKQNKIVPDADSYSMIYRLNPTVNDLKKIPPGTRISIPSINSRDAAGYQFKLQIDKDFKDKVSLQLKEAERLQKAVQETAHISQGNAEDEAAFKSTFQKFLTLSKKNYDFTVGDQRSLPVSREFVKQLNDDMTLCNKITSDALGARAITKSDVQVLASLTKDLEIKSEGLDQIMGIGVIPEPVTQADLTVNLHESAPRTHRSYPYRVHYATASGYHVRHEDHKFSRLSNPVTEKLERGNYIIWAARDADGVKVTNGIHEVPLRPPGAVSDITVVDTQP